MSVASLYTPCFVMFCVFLYGPFCHGAHKLDLSTLFTTFFLWTSLPFILIPKTFEDYVQNVYIIVCQNKLLTCSEFSWLLCFLSSQSCYMADVAELSTSHTNIFSVLFSRAGYASWGLSLSSVFYCYCVVIALCLTTLHLNTCTLHDPWGPEKYDYTMIYSDLFVLYSTYNAELQCCIDLYIIIFVQYVLISFTMLWCNLCSNKWIYLYNVSL